MVPSINKEFMSVMAKYLIAISGHTGTNWQIKGTALACYSLATLSTSSSYIDLKLETDKIQLWFSTQNMLTGSPMLLVL
jgi:hypothetical protein